MVRTGVETATDPQSGSPVSLEAVLCTEELSRRPSRSPDYQKENRALTRLVQALSDAPETILQTFADTILEVFEADSAGLSLLTTDDGGQRFYWPAIAGAWSAHVGGGTPRDFGPCGDVLDHNTPLLFRHFERRYPYLKEVTPAAEEALLIPFYVHGAAVGTIWAMAHDDCRRFDAEDVRQLESMGRFASVAYKAAERRQVEDSRRAALNLMEDAVHARQAVEHLYADLRVSEERYRDLFDSMDEGYCIIEMIFDAHENAVDYRFLEVNPAFEKQSGMHDVTGKRMLEFVPDIEEHWLANYGNVALTGEPIRFANEYKELGRWFDVYAFRVGADDSRRVAVLFKNITERNEAARALAESEERFRTQANELRQSVADLATADRHKNEFLATLAHELRNPLAPIRNSLQVLRMSSDNPDAVRAAKEMLERQVAQMVRLIDDLLDVSRISRGKVELRLEPVELASVVQLVVEASRPAYDNKGIELTAALPAQRIILDADSARLAQAVGNLLNNACKFTDPGGRVSLCVERDEGDAVIRVRDTGIGLAAEQLARVFDMFTQVDTSIERSAGGLGIGLTLVKDLVERHGGTVQAHSAGVGQGTEFEVRLPIASEIATPASAQPNGDEAAGITARRILVVDDNLDSATSMALLLEFAGNETRTVHDGVAAVEAAAAFKPHLVLLDIGLPRLNGYQAARRIREELWGKDMVLVALTGWGQDEDRQKSREAGFDDHVVKPVDYATLLRVLASHPVKSEQTG